MASISKLTTALFAGSQETTLALANLNFDFSLVKVRSLTRTILPVWLTGLASSMLP